MKTIFIALLLFLAGCGSPTSTQDTDPKPTQTPVVTATTQEKIPPNPCKPPKRWVYEGQSVTAPWRCK